MPLIITVTDFSDVANKAINYACRLASDLHASVLVLHPYILPITMNDDPMVMAPVTTIAPDDMEAVKTNLADMVSNLREVHTGVEITGKVIYSDVLYGIEDYAEQEKPLMIVIGNGDIDVSTWMGSGVVDALRNLPYPVLAVPPDTTYRPVKKMCLAYDFKHTASQSAIKSIMEMAGILHAELHILNVSTSDEGQANYIIPGTFKDSISALQPQYHFIAAELVDEAISIFVADNHVDWLTIIPHKPSFFERLFKKTHTEAMVQMSHVPILAMHDID